jgi:hypothetical protein
VTDLRSRVAGGVWDKAHAREKRRATHEHSLKCAQDMLLRVLAMGYVGVPFALASQFSCRLRPLDCDMFVRQLWVLLADGAWHDLWVPTPRPDPGLRSADDGLAGAGGADDMCIDLTQLADTLTDMEVDPDGHAADGGSDTDSVVSDVESSPEMRHAPRQDHTHPQCTRNRAVMR